MNTVAVVFACAAAYVITSLAYALHRASQTIDAILDELDDMQSLPTAIRPGPR